MPPGLPVDSPGGWALGYFHVAADPPYRTPADWLPAALPEVAAAVAKTSDVSVRTRGVRAHCLALIDLSPESDFSRLLDDAVGLLLRGRAYSMEIDCAEHLSLLPVSTAYASLPGDNAAVADTMAELSLVGEVTVTPELLAAAYKHDCQCRPVGAVALRLWHGSRLTGGVEQKWREGTTWNIEMFRLAGLPERIDRLFLKHSGA